MQNKSRASRAHRNHLLAAAVASIGLAGLGISSAAQGGLFVELRAVTVTGTGSTISPDRKSVTLGAIDGRTVTMGVYARVSGTNTVQNIYDIQGDGSELVTTNDDTFQTLVGAFSSTGLLKGNMGPPTPGPNAAYNSCFAPFNGNGSTNGAFADFDSDGDLDLGALGTDPTNMWAARASSPTMGARDSLDGNGWSQAGGFFVPNSQDTLIDATTSEVRIGTVRFIATGGSGTAAIQFIIRQNLDASAQWYEDGISTTKNPTNSPFTLGLPVTIAAPVVPEPAAMSLLGIASLGLVARRRRSIRS